MIDEKELRDSVEAYHEVKNKEDIAHASICDFFEPLVALAEAYLACEGLPEKDSEEAMTGIHRDLILMATARNKTIDDCRLAYTKKLMSGGLEVLLNKYQHEEGMELPSKYESYLNKFDLATDIRNYLTGTKGKYNFVKASSEEIAKRKEEK